MSPDFAWSHLTDVGQMNAECYAQCNILGRQPYGGGSVMVWRGVYSTARTDLHVFPRETMNSIVYVTDILEQYVVPFAPFIENNFIF
jgi:hypothetical protein